MAVSPYLVSYLLFGVGLFVGFLNDHDDEMCLLEFVAYAILIIPFWLILIIIGLLLDRKDSIVLKKAKGRRRWW